MLYEDEIDDTISVPAGCRGIIIACALSLAILIPFVLGVLVGRHWS